MEQVQNTAQPRVGAILREARERMGMSVEEVAIRLKFAPRQIVALEEDNYAQLPQMAFVRGFVRSYARLVLIDETPLLEALPGAPARETAPAAHVREDVLPGDIGARNQNLIWLAAALVVAVVIGILAWKYDAGNAVPKPASGAKPEVAAQSGANTPSATPQAGGEIATTPASQGNAVMQPAQGNTGIAAANPAASAPVATKPAQHPATHPQPHAAAASAVSAASSVAPNKASAPHKLGPSQLVRLEFDEDSWVDVTDANGKVLISTLGKTGSSLKASGPTPLTVTIGHAQGVRVYYKDQLLDLGAQTGKEVARLKLE
ncbi:MAG TPA: RodZ domain-containing protein [Gallionellaceae bacterium]